MEIMTCAFDARGDFRFDKIFSVATICLHAPEHIDI